jgi:hypothetical protein
MLGVDISEIVARSEPGQKRDEAARPVLPCLDDQGT